MCSSMMVEDSGVSAAVTDLLTSVLTSLMAVVGASYVSVSKLDMLFSSELKDAMLKLLRIADASVVSEVTSSLLFPYNCFSCNLVSYLVTSSLLSYNRFSSLIPSSLMIA